MEKKFTLCVLGCVLLITSVCFAACDKDPIPDKEPPSEQYTVSFETNGGEPLTSITVKSGESVTLLDAEKENYDFDGWYDNEGLDGERLSSPYTPIGSIKLYAKWKEIQGVYYGEYLTVTGYEEATGFPSFEGRALGKTLTSDDIGDMETVQYDLNAGVKVAKDCTVAWFKDEQCTEIVGSQKSTLVYGSNNFFCAVSGKNGVVLKTYVFSVYVKHDFIYTFFAVPSGFRDKYDVEPIEAQRIVEGNIPKIPVPDNGYTVKKWVDGFGKEVDLSVAPSQSLWLYAEYEDITCSVDLNGGSGSTEVVYTPFESVSVPEYYGSADRVYDGLFAGSIRLTDEKHEAAETAVSVSADAVKNLTVGWTEFTQERYFNGYDDYKNDGYVLRLEELPQCKLIRIPRTYNGKNVTAISSCSVNKTGYEVVIPETVKEIYTQAFSGSKIESITIPASVTEIGMQAFRGCSYLKSVTVWSDTLDGSSDAFQLCGSLKTLYWNAPNYVMPRGDGPFGSVRFDKIIVGDNVENLPKSIFAKQTEVESIALPFVGASANADTNTHFGYIFGADTYEQNADVVPRSLREVTVTGGRISANAFNGALAITYYISIGDGVTAIGENAFKNCTGLYKIVIPTSISEIPANAFDSCSYLENVYYRGTRQEWDAVTVSSGNDALTAAAIYFYSETAPTETGNYWHYENGVPTNW